MCICEPMSAVLECEDNRTLDLYRSLSSFTSSVLAVSFSLIPKGLSENNRDCKCNKADINKCGRIPTGLVPIPARLHQA